MAVILKSNCSNVVKVNILYEDSYNNKVDLIMKRKNSGSIFKA